MKKERAYIRLLLWGMLILFLQGCVRDDRSDCPEDEVPRLILDFSYLDSLEEGGEHVDMFADSIHMVDVLVFDNNLNLYTYVTLGAEVKQTRRAELFVEPGDYHIVCWANNSAGSVDHNTRNRFGEITLDLDDRESIAPLYYAPDRREPPTRGSRADEMPGDELAAYRVSVAPVGVTHHPMPFMSAHRILKVTLVNFPDVADQGTGNPTVSVTNLISEYDLQLNRGEEKVNFVKTPETIKDTDDRVLGFTSYYLPHFDNDNPVEVVISGRDGSSPYRHVVPMRRILDELYPEWVLYDGDNRTIEVEIDWNDGVWVEIRVATWKVNDTDPNYNG